MADYKIPSLTTDIFIFDEDFNFILIKRKNNPFKDHWALPGGFVEYGESVETAACRAADLGDDAAYNVCRCVAWRQPQELLYGEPLCIQPCACEGQRGQKNDNPFHVCKYNDFCILQR